MTPPPLDYESPRDRQRTPPRWRRVINNFGIHIYFAIGLIALTIDLLTQPHRRPTATPPPPTTAPAPATRPAVNVTLPPL